MAQIHDRKSNFYSQKQSIRDELSAPQHLESAGDELIKILAKKQTNTSTSLQEQLQTVQNFERGFELSPYSQKGITTLEDFQKHVAEDQEISTSSTKSEEIGSMDELMKITGLSRHEIELCLCEKPDSTVSQLYMFAVKNKMLNKKPESLKTKLLHHPINRLKEIEEEFLDQMKKMKTASKEAESRSEQKQEEVAEVETSRVEGKSRKKKKHRKRRKKGGANSTERVVKKPVSGNPPQESLVQPKDEEEEHLRGSTSRVSLWDIKSMKNWSETKEIGCKPQAFYTIKDGKIIKLENESGREEDST